MISNKFIIFSLAVAGCTAAAYSIALRRRQLAKRELKESLRTWEDEGGTLAPAAVPAVARPAEDR